MNDSPEQVRASLHQMHAHLVEVMAEYGTIGPLAARMHLSTRRALARMGFMRGCRLDVGEGWAIRVFTRWWCPPDEIQVTLESAIRRGVARALFFEPQRRRRKWRRHGS